ncbi:DNA polymerase zeta catalytic subunit isoform X1 [Glossina fuscipes]|uniref:DNA polymerase zeta catalytic subunit n=1 Tax=Glossina fuscipes TaxID=7396 RepID=A0A9C5YYL8_9MUSC|nr:DNA polymerase zeta catalytic subunit isoform X1 [Glossina fuscipes]
MSQKEEIFSMRLVIADFYMEKPVFGLDACYSEFRGKQIKRVPVIRIFGSTAQGHKCCMHVHGVFPYFYIPYEQKEFDSISKAVYQIAMNIDKAINISLGQGSSETQHVFKVQLVKGIPFYGYHRKEHYFLKIYMYNPRFVRRAAGMLQNGVILNKVFQPHESHVPYILQFMIDYNLYGMSFIHTPFDIVKFRRATDADVIPFKDLSDIQILNCHTVKKLTNCALEVDILAIFILNRFQLLYKSSGSKHTNPGIESIWHDEKMRRQETFERCEHEQKEIPPLEIPPPQHRPLVKITENEEFYRTALLSKLMSSSSICSSGSTLADQTLNSVLINNTAVGINSDKRKFNLSKLVQNSVYPEECTQPDNIINASFVENHLSNHNTFEERLTANNLKKLHTVDEEEEENVNLDDTVIDEKLVMNLTQNSRIAFEATLRQEDIELLDVLEQLETSDNSNKIDLDSTLAPLTQNSSNPLISPQSLHKEITNGNNADTSTEEEENVLDFSMALESFDDLILKLTQSQKISNGEKLPQIDGTDDVQGTPKKLTPPRLTQTPKRRRLTVTSPQRSPRTPKTLHKYAPLPLIITNMSTGKKVFTNPLNETTPVKENCKEKVNRPLPRKRLTLTEMRRHSISEGNEVLKSGNAKDSEVQTSKTPNKHNDLEKTYITCALTPRSKKEKKLKTYSIGHQDKDEKREPSKNAVSCEEMHNGLDDVKSKTQKKSSADESKLEGFLNQKDSETTDATDSEISEIIDCSDDEAKTFNRKLCLKRFKRTKNSVRNRKKLTRNRLIKDGTEGKKNCKKCCVRLKRTKIDCPKKGHSANEIAKRSPELLLSTPATINFSSVKNTAKKPLRKCGVKLKRLRVDPNSSQLMHERRIDRAQMLNSPSLSIAETCNVFSADNVDDVDDDPCIISFYEDSMQSPSLFTQDSSPVVSENNCRPSIMPLLALSNIAKALLPISSDRESNDLVTITPMCSPPTRKMVLEGCEKLRLPEHEFQQPFYGNPDDITKHKEVGYTVLHIPGNKLNDLKEFQSVLETDNIMGITAWRRNKLHEIGGMEMLNKYRTSPQIREYCANQKALTITPQLMAPTKHEVRLWLKAREFLKGKEDAATVKVDDIDSPIKIRRQKITMIFKADEGNEASEDSDNSEQCTTHSLAMTPLTPGTPLIDGKVGNKTDSLRKIFTPVSNRTENSESNSSKELKLTSLRKRLSLSCKPEEILNKRRDSINDDSNQEIMISQTTSESSISSQTILAELERSSFRREIQKENLQSQNDCADLSNSYGFKVALENLQQAKADVECTYLTILTLEVFVSTRGDLFPNPEIDAIRCLFYAIENSIPSNQQDASNKLPGKACGCIMVKDECDLLERQSFRHGLDTDIEVTLADNEIEALEALLRLCNRWDPDIYAGYEIEMSSWGFVIERAKYLCVNIAPLLSRVPTQKGRDFIDEDNEQFTDLDVEMKLCGRILLDVWRLMRSEIALTSYTFENVMYHILHKRCPWHSYRSLTEWFSAPCSRWIVLEYYLERVRGTLTLLDQLDLIGRTSEMAKLIGIQFYEVLSRGSQFRVESMMLRIAKPKNLVALSPSVQQRAHMRAPEYLPLIMEPLSRFYADPLIVLDFQSLYPSVIIAYNYCFSTCLGRVEHIGQSLPFEFGASQLRVSPSMLRKLLDRDLITISPCGAVFVKSSVREGILPRMLTEILDTRQMVKQSMKLYKSSSALQRVLHSRQLGLKLMANVTYGYTAANFSGRMPAVEVGDSVVAKGREALERAIKLVETNEKWNVKVVYGDTDSMFVLVPGRNREEAFRIGTEIAEAVTQANPHPVKLKLEKVYQPCILQTKKRYVGYMYETVEQKEPIYEAKGIETVRRDGCPIVAKMLEKVLRILFETADVSQVKQYVCRQFTKLLSGRANLQDLIFAKEFRGLKGYKPNACVPALEMTRKWIQTDPRRIPRRGERVPFIIINGPPGVPLIRLVRHPHEILNDDAFKINALYYITKAIIAPLNRCLLLIGADVNEWFADLPRKVFSTPALSTANELIVQENDKTKKSTISQFFSTINCVLDCGRQTKHGICMECARNAQYSVSVLQMKISKIERGFLTTQQICQSCSGRVGNINCQSLDCPVVFVTEVKRRDLKQLVTRVRTRFYDF